MDLMLEFIGLSISMEEVSVRSIPKPPPPPPPPEPNP